MALRCAPRNTRIAKTVHSESVQSLPLVVSTQRRADISFYGNLAWLWSSRQAPPSSCPLLQSPIPILLSLRARCEPRSHSMHPAVSSGGWTTGFKRWRHFRKKALRLIEKCFDFVLIDGRLGLACIVHLRSLSLGFYSLFGLLFLFFPLITLCNF